MQGAQYGSNTWFLIIIYKKKPPAKAVVKHVALAGFFKRPQSDSNQRYILIKPLVYINVN